MLTSIKVKYFLLFILFAAGTAKAQNMAFLSKEKLFPMLKGYTAKQAAADTLRVQLSREIQKQQDDLQKKFRELIKSYNPKESETTETIVKRFNSMDQEKFKLLQEEQKLQDTRIKSFNKQLDDLYSRDIKPYLVQMETALQQYAQKNKVDAVWYLEEAGQALPYYNKSRDITAIIADAVNKVLQ